MEGGGGLRHSAVVRLRPGDPAPVGHRWAHAEQGTWGSRTRKHREAGCGRPEDGGVEAVLDVAWCAICASAAPSSWHIEVVLHTNHWAPRTRKQHQQEYRPQRPTESSNSTQHAEGRTGDCPGPHKETATRRNVTQGGREVLEWPYTVGGGGYSPPDPPTPPDQSDHSGGKTNFTIGKIWLRHFRYRN